MDLYLQVIRSIYGIILKRLIVNYRKMVLFKKKNVKEIDLVYSVCKMSYKGCKIVKGYL